MLIEGHYERETRHSSDIHVTLNLCGIIVPKVKRNMLSIFQNKSVKK